VLVIDNASWHYSKEVRQICKNAGVKLVYLPPYSPDFNPIKEFFSILKSFIRRYWRKNKDIIDIDFKKYLGWCIDKVGSYSCIIEAYFQHAGHRIQQTQE
jgi:transposase